jgi:hypothetical protein
MLMANASPSAVHLPCVTNHVFFFFKQHGHWRIDHPFDCGDPLGQVGSDWQLGGFAPTISISQRQHRRLADLYVRKNYVGEFRIRVQLESGQRYVITIKEER